MAKNGPGRRIRGRAAVGGHDLRQLVSGVLGFMGVLLVFSLV